MFRTITDSTAIDSVSVTSANGFAGTSSGGQNPSLTLSTTVTGMVKGNGTALSAAVSGTDYQAPISSSTGSAHQWINSFTAPNSFGYSQPSFSDLSGTATVSQLPVMVGDSGAGGTAGIVPAPPALSYEQGNFLGANGTWSYVDQSKPRFADFSLVSTAAFSGNAKFENTKFYTGLTGKRYAVVAAGGTSTSMVIYDVTNPAIAVQQSSTLLSGTYNIDVATISNHVYA